MLADVVLVFVDDARDRVLSHRFPSDFTKDVIEVRS